MTEEKGNWNFVDKRQSDNPESEENSTVPTIIRADDTAMELRSAAKSMIAQWKEKKVTQNAALTILKEKMGAHIEATKYALTKQLELHNKKIDLLADKYIYQMTEEYLKDLNEMGISNLKSRGITVQVLNEETAKLLKQIESQDVPDFMKKKTLEMMMDKWMELFAKISN